MEVRIFDPLLVLGIFGVALGNEWNLNNFGRLENLAKHVAIQTTDVNIVSTETGCFGGETRNCLCLPYKARSKVMVDLFQSRPALTDDVQELQPAVSLVWRSETEGLWNVSMDHQSDALI